MFDLVQANRTEGPKGWENLARTFLGAAAVYDRAEHGKHKQNFASHGASQGPAEGVDVVEHGQR